ncbi:PREDICTED: WEB family protein At5g55860-like [Tarenaya hassleriana]|uniref:WEB family protein At5g55860-like n=1 Tax=Tarenaya hassleriana TaxID=28532 RepID=UPI00053C6B6F|nr:PREDICTED: WEB family protein At5g55860-like [Tarenaya hassleriana]XP_010542514.1 PREDICTED: WEB family protein At5g55860-like [Tarenaya hassleriana]XP_010542515.1 PREDICTED: WEB family protein At5g55860-like [Tarenaya hassleriana]XP_010542516.1 PREDICTED: WEB family protein At5g55860-like [Tarenaya hassleriana]XP_010542517.1 PREDICTED: WEB family protein At5g55860-like [Tarenaya hassleriana]
MAAKGERDTSSSLQSVKDAVILFGTRPLSRNKRIMASNLSANRSRRTPNEETKLHLSRKQLNKLKEDIKKADARKAEAVLELEKAKTVVVDLSDKVRAADESAESAISATEMAGNQGKRNKQADSAQKQDLKSTVDIYAAVFSKLDQKKQEIWKICQDMRNVEGIDLDSVRVVTSNLDIAKESLQRVAEEEIGLCKTLESLKLELKNVQKEHAGLIEKEIEMEAIARDLHAKLQKTKADLEIEAEAEELRKEAEDVNIELRKLEEQLKAALFEAEEAKAAKERALECVKGFAFSESTDVTRASFSEPVSRITISLEKFESLRKKAEEFNNLAQVHATRACMDEALKKLEMSKGEIKGLQAEVTEAVQKAEIAEEGKRSVEADLKRWREREQKKAAEIATRILSETEIPVKSSSLHNSEIPKNSGKKLRKPKTEASKKVISTSVSGIFRRTKNQDDVRFASCLPS